MFHQGASDAATQAAATSWGDDFLTMVAAVRAVGAVPDDLPVLYTSERWGSYPDDFGGLDPDDFVGALPGGPFRAHVLAEQWAVRDALDRLHLTIVRDVPVGPDGVHHSTRGVRSVGRALAATYLDAVAVPA